jgi:NADPH:quinone reductase-like Zn-dependent oxidoreductase
MKLYRIEKEFGIDALRLAEEEVPKPGPQQVLVRMRAASVNYRDLLVIDGKDSRKLPFPLVCERSSKKGPVTAK